jgi:hypothetical protein
LIESAHSQIEPLSLTRLLLSGSWHPLILLPTPTNVLKV